VPSARPRPRGCPLPTWLPPGVGQGPAALPQPLRSLQQNPQQPQPVASVTQGANKYERRMFRREEVMDESAGAECEERGGVTELPGSAASAADGAMGGHRPSVTSLSFFLLF